MTSPEPGNSVTYSVKELLQDISRKIDNLDLKLESKADARALDQLSSLMADTRTRVSNLETVNLTKGRFNALWIPIVFSNLVALALAYFAYAK